MLSYNVLILFTSTTGDVSVSGGVTTVDTNGASPQFTLTSPLVDLLPLSPGQKTPHL